VVRFEGFLVNRDMYTHNLLSIIVSKYVNLLKFALPILSMNEGSSILQKPTRTVGCENWYVIEDGETEGVHRVVTNINS
jgi:hypothetical protein